MNFSTIGKRRSKGVDPVLKPMTKSKHFKEDIFYYQEISELTRAGGWSVDFVAKKSHFDDQARRILKTPDDFEPSLKNGYKFYAEEHLDIATEFFFGCAMGKSFSTEIKMMTYDGEVFWAKAQGKPLRNSEDEIIGIRGVFQSIDEIKKKEIQLEDSIKIIEGHNDRLYDFAHIISHNLRSQVSNLLMSSSLFEKDNLTQDQIELLENFNKIGENLDETLRHLNKIVSVHNAVHKGKEMVSIPEIYNRVIGAINHTCQSSRAVIYTDFSEVEDVEYVEAYLESIIQNLLTNAIKYKHPDRDPEINLFTYEENDKKYLAIQDNGLGIDLEKHGKEIFQLYKTFHSNDDSQGLGLFLIKNEVEAMGGAISVESKLGKGSKFTVQL